ncbi:M16 family metallopeptidase [Leptothoe spongobia]|uniref:Insulinase family protein n=1 Tax=Leptothoe spongobia TAU-MAC 1115 TaxID=1967444 RepID=A0A947DD23_9CYAN|nr:pitrilysin family protein [Leptothoe spongobia]MBT9314114.1 insulinase family protein [Leptothoe spongobia TAU-MAC 1115]
MSSVSDVSASNSSDGGRFKRPFPANVVRLDSGLTVIHQEIATTPVVVVDVWIKAGARYEPETWTGMAHFLEHMVFKGTEQILPGMFDAAIESRGGLTNAATSHDYAHFYMTVAADDLAHALPYLADLLLHAAIPADEFVRERHVVIEEIHQSWDDPDWIGFQTLSEMVYGDHPYSRSVLGAPEILQERSPEEMRQFHRTHYQPDNMQVVITGGVSLDRVLELVQTTFRTFPHRESCPTMGSIAHPRLLTNPQHTLALPRLEHGRLVMAWLGPGIDDLKTACGLDILATVLAEGRMSRLVRELREDRQWVDEIASSFSVQQDCSLFVLSSWLAPDHIKEVGQVICDRIASLATIPITTPELERAQRVLCNDYAFSMETPGQLAGLYGYYGTLATPELSLAYPGYIESYTIEQLMPLAKQYLSPDHCGTLALTPA